MDLGKSGKISGVGGMVLDVGRHDLILPDHSDPGVSPLLLNCSYIRELSKRVVMELDLPGQLAEM